MANNVDEYIYVTYCIPRYSQNYVHHGVFGLMLRPWHEQRNPMAFAIMSYSMWLLWVPLCGLLLRTHSSLAAIATTPSPMLVINSAGSCKNESAIKSFFKTLGDSTSSIIHALDCTTDENGAQSINKLLHTNFKGTIGMQLAVAPGNRLVTLSQFDSLFSNNFCGAKAVELSYELSGRKVVFLSASCVNSSLKAYDQLLRRLVLNSLKESACPNFDFIVCKKNDPSSSGVSDAEPSSRYSGSESRDISDSKISSHVSATVHSLWADMAGNSSTRVGDAPLFRVFVVDVSPGKAQEKASQLSDDDMLQKLGSTDVRHSRNSRATVGELSAALVTKWPVVHRRRLGRIDSSARKRALLDIGTAYSAVLAHADSVMAQWHERVSSGKVVGSYAARVRQLLRGALTAFDQRTRHCQEAAEARLQHFMQLKDYIMYAADRMYGQQMLLVENEVKKGVTKELLKSAAEGLRQGKAAPEMASATTQAVLERGVEQFLIKSADLNDDYLNLTHSGTAALREQLQKIVTEFPETGLYQLEELKALSAERPESSRSSSSKKGGKGLAGLFPAFKALNVAFGLVGMLRPPGYGNFQGFVSYAASLFGFPLELLLGMQNDGDSPEVGI